MKPLGLALIAILAIGCNATPTSPTSSIGQVTAVTSQDVKPDHTPGTVKVPIYFYVPGMPIGGNVHMTGIEVEVWYGNVEHMFVETGKQGSINIDVPKDVTRVYVSIAPQAYTVNGWSGCVYLGEGSVPVPYALRENFIAVSTGCTVF
jgi:hypothetical protein